MTVTLMQPPSPSVDLSRQYSEASSASEWRCWLSLLAVKPVIDLTWSFQLGSVFGVGLNPLRIVGALVFVIALVVVSLDPPKRLASRVWICFFLVAHLSFLMGLGFGKIKLGSLVDIFLRVGDAFLVYAIFSRMWAHPRRLIQISIYVWFSVLIVNSISVFVWLSGNYHIDTSQNVVRYAGLYNDPGIPSYNAVFAIVFATLYMGLMKHYGFRLPYIVRVLFVITLVMSGLLLGVTLTKNAFLMLVVFVAGYWGLFQKKHYLIFPALAIAAWVVYSQFESVQTRMAPEIRVFVEGDHSDAAFAAMGTGRWGVWVRLVNMYLGWPIQYQLFGKGRGFGAHNQYIEYLLQMGIFGLGCFACLMTSFMYQLRRGLERTENPAPAMGMVALSMFLFGGLTGHPFGYTTLYWYVLIIVSMTNAPAHVLAPAAWRHKSQRNWSLATESR